MRAIIRYPGSKWKIADWIISHFPDGYDKMVYLEPFCGSGAVFFNKKPGAVETVNDLDSDIVNLFRVLREQPDDLKRALELTPYSREEYDLSFEPCDDPVEKARRYMVKTTQAIGAKLAGSSKCGWRNHKQIKIGGTACKWGGITETIDTAATRLRGDSTHLVQIEHMDALRLIERYNSPDVLMYLDPPYVRAVRRSGALYAHEMDAAGQVELLEIITKSRAKIIISGYESDLYNTALAGWHKDSTMSQITSAEMATEVIWMNYEPPMQQLSILEEG
ncbi:MAG: DNA adenine methylase [Monoglobaceae bacterium]